MYKEDYEKTTPSANPETRIVVFLEDVKAKPSLTTHIHEHTQQSLIYVLPMIVYATRHPEKPQTSSKGRRRE